MSTITLGCVTISNYPTLSDIETYNIEVKESPVNISGNKITYEIVGMYYYLTDFSTTSSLTSLAQIPTNNYYTIVNGSNYNNGLPGSAGSCIIAYFSTNGTLVNAPDNIKSQYPGCEYCFFQGDSSGDLYTTTGNIYTITTQKIYVTYLDSLGDVIKTVAVYTYFNSYLPSCFNEGTKILCLNKELEEEYIPIEKLKKGDIVKSYKHGYRKIDMIGKNTMVNNPKFFNLCMYKMEKTETNGLIEDLIVTGGHGILVDELGDLEEKNKKLFKGVIPEIDDKKLLLAGVSKDFTKLENNDLYTYYHLTLENDGDDDKRFGIWANGILTETPSKKQFLQKKYEKI